MNIELLRLLRHRNIRELAVLYFSFRYFERSTLEHSIRERYDSCANTIITTLIVLSGAENLPSVRGYIHAELMKIG